MTALSLTGWAAALALGVWALLLRARLQAVARADHELRGPVTALALAAAGLARAPGMRERGIAIEAQVLRLRAALGDLAAARRLPCRGAAATCEPAVALEADVRAAAAGWAPVAQALGRDLRVDWRAGQVAARLDRGRLAQALGNVLANALEHGRGPVAVCAAPAPGGVRIEVRDGGPTAAPRGRRSDRGRGLAIAAAAVEEGGGRLSLEHGSAGTVAVLELPGAS